MISLGLSDLVPLHDIYNECRRLEKEFNWGFQWKVDNGAYETAIEFYETIQFPFKLEAYHPPISKDWSTVRFLKCPDILHWDDKGVKIAIEYEEEPKLSKLGPKKGKKGHSEFNSKDVERNTLYKLSGIYLFQVWQTHYEDGSYKKKLKKFLTDVYCKRIDP